VRIGSECFHALKKALHDAGHNTNVGDEGGFAPNIGSAEEALAFIAKACEAAGHRPGEDVMLGLDVAATEFFKDGKYVMEGEGKTLDSGRHGRLPGRPLRQVPDRLHRGRLRRGRLGRLEAADREARRQGPAGRRRPVLHQSRAAPAASRRARPIRSW
jgi:hypothetical protein